MEQLVMRWQNDGQAAEELPMPDGVFVRNWTETEDPVETWLDIVQYGLTEKKEDEAFWRRCNEHYPYYQPTDCWFFLCDGKEAATVTVICDPVKQEGYVHMVAAKPETRGRGIGNLMARFAVKICREKGMQTAFLTTDDFRIPAIRSYLAGGFTPDVSTADFRERWEKIYEKIGKR